MVSGGVRGMSTKQEMYIDFLESLLAKYIDHVGSCEGVDFIPRGIGTTSPFGRVYDNEGFTDKELEVLWEAANWDEEKGEHK